jgi:hypothetical protein
VERREFVVRLAGGPVVVRRAVFGAQDAEQRVGGDLLAVERAAAQDRIRSIGHESI